MRGRHVSYRTPPATAMLLEAGKTVAALVVIWSLLGVAVGLGLFVAVAARPDILLVLGRG